MENDPLLTPPPKIWNFPYVLSLFFFESFPNFTVTSLTKLIILILSRTFVKEIGKYLEKFKCLPIIRPGHRIRHETITPLVIGWNCQWLRFFSEFSAALISYWSDLNCCIRIGGHLGNPNVTIFSRNWYYQYLNKIVDENMLN